MRRYPVSMILLCLCLCLAGALPRPALADPPAADCALSAVAANDIALVPTCDPLLCDVMADPSGSIAPPFEGIRVGDSFSTATAEWPRFFYDEVANQFHTRLFSQIYTYGGENVASGRVQVNFSVKPNAAGIADTGGVFKPIGFYVMDIPPSGGPFSGLLTPAALHVQEEPVCWLVDAGFTFPKKFLLKIETNWPPDEDASNDVRYRFYDFAADAPPADIAFALDLSGSMAAPVPGGALSRLTVAKLRAWLFIDAIEPAEGNRFGAFGFATGMPAALKSDFTGTWQRVFPPGETSAVLSETGVLFPFTELAVAADKNDAISSLFAPLVQPYGCTPIGQGLLRAKKELLSLVTPLGDPDHHKAIVLFSDGLQNVGPFVRNTPDWTCGAPSALPTIHARKTFKENNPTLPVYSVFFGTEMASPWNHELMVHIQHETGGDYLYYTVDSMDLAAAYFQIRHLVASNAMLFLDEEGQVTAPLPGPTATVSFDGAADIATVAVAWPASSQQTALIVEGRRQGEGEDAWRELSELPQPAGDAAGATATAAAGTTALAATTPRPGGPHRVYRFIPGPNTTWQLRVRSPGRESGTIDYALAVFAPSSEARMRASLGAETFRAGDALPIFADLRFLGHPIVGATVKATVTLPERASSNVLRRYGDRLDPGSPITDTTIPDLADQLRKLVLAAEGSEQLTATRQVEVTLTDGGGTVDEVAGDGVYSGRLDGAETTVAGLYDFLVSATGTLPSGTDFARSEKLGAVAGVGPADPARTKVRFGDRVALDNGMFAVPVTVLAADRFGNATYPGAGSGIRVTPRPGGGTNLGDLADNLDSTYTQTVEVAPGQDPSVDVGVGAVDLGAFSPSPTGQAPLGYSLSLHLGSAVPHGAFGTVFDTGPSLAIDLEYRFGPRFALRGELGWNEFGGKFGPDLSLYHLIPYVQFRRPGPGWEPYVEAGFGLYDLESVGTAAGFAVGAGAQRDLAGPWRLDLGIHSHHAGGGLDVSYSQLAVGILYTNP